MLFETGGHLVHDAWAGNVKWDYSSSDYPNAPVWLGYNFNMIRRTPGPYWDYSPSTSYIKLWYETSVGKYIWRYRYDYTPPGEWAFGYSCDTLFGLYRRDFPVGVLPNLQGGVGSVNSPWPPYE
jgi:hypothetical protein